MWGYPFSLVRRLLIVFFCLLSLCAAGAYILSQPIDPLYIVVHLVPVAVAILFAMYVAELVGVTERPQPPLSVEALFWAIATSCLVMGIGYALVPTYAPSTWLACAAPVVAALCVFLHRKYKETFGPGDEELPSVLFAGTRADAARGMADLADAPGVVVQAILLPVVVRDRAPMAGLPVLTPEEALNGFRHDDTRLFLVGRAPPEALRPILAPCAGLGCVVETVDELVAKSQGRVNLTDGDDVALLNRLSTQANRFAAQRLLDLVFVHILIPIFVVPALLSALLIKLTSRGPVFFRQKRVGRWGHEFTIFKFRTMYRDAEKETGPVFAREGDPRITPLGRILRRTRVDELPQLINVLLGQMSLVGPRPERRYFVRTLRETIPLYDARHSVRPGVTGWAQIRYGYGANEHDARKKLGYELFYILNRSFTFYCTVLLETVKVLVFRRGGR
ncbi:MAG: sugar transferase [Planctomycetota bacterium]